MSETVSQAIIAGIVTIALAYIGMMVRDVKKTGEAVHVLTNANMGRQLRVSSAALQRVADMTGDETDVKVAKEARALLADHEAQQKVVDSKPAAK